MRKFAGDVLGWTIKGALAASLSCHVLAAADRWTAANQGLPVQTLTPMPGKLAMDAAGNLYLGSDAGIFKRTAGAQSWQAVNNGLPLDENGERPIVRSLLSGVAGKLYVALKSAASGRSLGIYRSSNQGEYWSLLTATDFPAAAGGDPYDVAAMASDSQDNLYVQACQTWATLGASGPFVHSECELRKLEAKASAWRRIGLGASVYLAPYWASIRIDAQDNLYVLTSSVVLKSRDGGISWRSLSDGSSYGNQLAVSAAGTIFRGGGGVVKSADEGATWVQGNAGLPLNRDGSQADLRFIEVASEKLIYAGATSYRFADSSASYTTRKALYRSVDGGASWQETSAAPGGDIESVLPVSNGQLYAATAQGVVFSQDQGASWQEVGKDFGGPPQIVANAVAVDAAYNLWLATPEGVFKRSYPAASWQAANAGLPRDATGRLPAVQALVSDVRGDITLASSAGIFQQRSDHAAWQTWADGLPADTLGATLSTDAAGNLYIASSSAVYQRKAGDTAWRSVGGNLPADTTVSALAITAAGKIYAGTRRGRVLELDPGGKQWLDSGQVLTSYFGEVQTIPALAVDAAGIVWAATRNAAELGYPDNPAVGSGVFRRGVDGRWLQMQGQGLPQRNRGIASFVLAINALLLDAQGRLHAATMAGVYQSSDGGETWFANQTGLPVAVGNLTDFVNSNSVAIPSLALDASGNRYALTARHGVFIIGPGVPNGMPVADILLPPAISKPVPAGWSELSRFPLFDIGYYQLRNPFLASALGTDVENYVQHWLHDGLAERREGSVFFDAIWYLQRNRDLLEAFGGDAIIAAQHYLNFGLHERREASPAFSQAYYRERNPDLQDIYVGFDDLAYLQHYASYGIKECRIASRYFDPRYYLANNPDVARAVNNDCAGALIHWLNNGRKEQRLASPIQAPLYPRRNVWP